MNSLQIYDDISSYSEVLGASHHRQIQLLLEKLLSHLNAAIQAIDNKNIPEKCKRICSAHDIVLFLRSCLDLSQPSSLISKLDDAYDYLEKELLFANAKNSVTAIEDCIFMTTKIKVWWDTLGD